MAAGPPTNTATVSLLPGRMLNPATWCFYPEDSNVCVVGGWDDDGQLFVSSYNNTVITGLEGVMAIGKPAHYENYAV